MYFHFPLKMGGGEGRSELCEESIKVLHWLFLVILDGFRLFKVGLGRFKWS